MIKKAVEKYRAKRDSDTLEEDAGPGGKGTIMVDSVKELSKILDKHKVKGGCLSPGGAAGRLGVSRQYIAHLEKIGKIRAFRIPSELLEWDALPLWARLITVKRSMYIYIPVEDVDGVKKEMIEKAEAKIRKLKGAK
jgi:hypothetical protein